MPLPPVSPESMVRIPNTGDKDHPFLYYPIQRRITVGDVTFVTTWRAGIFTRSNTPNSAWQQRALTGKTVYDIATDGQVFLIGCEDGVYSPVDSLLINWQPLGLHGKKVTSLKFLQGNFFAGTPKHGGFMSSNGLEWVSTAALNQLAFSTMKNILSLNGTCIGDFLYYDNMIHATTSVGNFVSVDGLNWRPESVVYPKM